MCIRDRLCACQRTSTEFHYFWHNIFSSTLSNDVGIKSPRLLYQTDPAEHLPAQCLVFCLKIFFLHTLCEVSEVFLPVLKMYHPASGERCCNRIFRSGLCPDEETSLGLADVCQLYFLFVPEAHDHLALMSCTVDDIRYYRAGGGKLTCACLLYTS